MRYFNTDSEVPFHTIRQTARMTGLSECYLRQQCKKSLLPGIYSGGTFKVDVPTLLQKIRNLPQK